MLYFRNYKTNSLKESIILKDLTETIACIS